MGKLIVSAQMTIDGVIDHSEEWFIAEGEHEDAGFDELRSADMLLLGRKTVTCHGTASWSTATCSQRCRSSSARVWQTC